MPDCSSVRSTLDPPRAALALLRSCRAVATTSSTASTPTDTGNATSRARLGEVDELLTTMDEPLLAKVKNSALLRKIDLLAVMFHRNIMYGVSYCSTLLSSMVGSTHEAAVSDSTVSSSHIAVGVDAWYTADGSGVLGWMSMTKGRDVKCVPVSCSSSPPSQPLSVTLLLATTSPQPPTAVTLRMRGAAGSSHAS